MSEWTACWLFFLQAEDGIRVHCVAGVQTCALPIFAGVVKEAVENAAGLLGARPVPTASVPVVLHPHAAAMILGVLGSSFSADAVIKRRSLLAGKVGEQVAAEIVTITDDPRLPEGLASRPFDGEGVPAA